MGKYEHITHSFAPVFDERSRILILGSLPSVKSREEGFYYGHPRNRFWKVLAQITGEELPREIGEKKAMLLKHGIAIWDVIASCDIIGSSDSSIKNVEPVDIERVMENSRIERIYANGRTAGKLYRKYLQPITGMPAMELPSTSPANAAWNLERLVDEWSEKFPKVSNE
ncbi:MAG: DNA-deoxyinosine glycosylase [Lachnospiraceae bacterium]|nr:DNA-deoxyinosine glycosylase [Lachnospiraceae bacterium]